MFFLGIDGGGTKTAFRLIDEKGDLLAEAEESGCNFRDIGLDAAMEILETGANKVCEANGITIQALNGTAIGMPCFGESEQYDAELLRRTAEVFGEKRRLLCNDSRVALAGSLSLRPGINIVAGTGSIAYGENACGECARAGGYDTLFSDEGSCYWTGREAMTLFSRQMDGREPRGALYDIFIETFHLKNAMAFMDLAEEEIIPFRHKVAAMNKLLLKAAQAGDQTAVRIYESAAMQLFDMIAAVRKTLRFDTPNVPVSHSGGLFHAAEFVLPTLTEKLKTIGCELCKPEHSPVWGAAMLARKEFLCRL